MAALVPNAVRRFLPMGLVASALSASLAACNDHTEAAAPEPRPVRTVTVEKHDVGMPVTLTGRIEAEDEVELGFRISGRLLENNGKLGDRVETGQLVARLEAKRDEPAQIRSGQSCRGAGGTDASAKPLRTPGHTSQAGLDHARQS